MEPITVYIEGVKIEPKQEVELEASFEDGSGTLHLTQVALGEKPASGPHTVFVHQGGNKHPIGTLEKGRCEQFQVVRRAGTCSALGGLTASAGTCRLKCVVTQWRHSRLMLLTHGTGSDAVGVFHGRISLWQVGRTHHGLPDASPELVRLRLLRLRGVVR